MQSDTHRLSFASDGLPWQRSLRWERPPNDLLRIALGLLLGALATMIELVGFDVGMRWQIAHEARPAPAISVQVSLVEEQLLPTPPEPEARPKVAPRTQPVVSGHTSRAGISPARVETRRAPVLALFDTDGHLRLPESATQSEKEVAFGARSQHPADPFARRNPVPYMPTYFERAWTPANESLGAELIRRALVLRTWRTPWGTQISCAVLLVPVIGGCGWGYAPTATIEELKAMRVELPMPKQPANEADTTQAPALPEEPAAPSGP